MNQPKFSVVLIARNEEKTLPKLFESLNEFKKRTGEIILVDTGSTDNTAQVARDFGCIVKEVGNKFQRVITEDEEFNINVDFSRAGEENIVKEGDTLFDYSAARNYAASFASNDMIATPDCDEAYTNLDIDKVNVQINEGADQLEYNFVFSHDEYGGELIKFLHSKFYNRKKFKWTGVIHESLIGEGKYQKKVLNEDVIKLEHWQNAETNRSHYLKGLALSVYENPSNDRNAHYFARELMYTGRFKSAIDMFEKHVAMNKWAAERSQSLLHIGDCYMSLGLSKKAIHSWIDAFDIAPKRREPMMKIAEYYYRMRGVDHVISYVAAALQAKGDNFYGDLQHYYENYPHELMYWALMEKGETAAAKQHFDICFAYQPFNPKYLHDYRYFNPLPTVSIVIHRKEGEKPDITIDSIKKLNYPQDKIQVLVEATGDDIDDSGEWTLHIENDMEFTPDSLIAAFKTAKDNGMRLMAFNTGNESVEAFMIHMLLKEKIGEKFDRKKAWAQAEELGHAMKCDRALIIIKN